MRKEERKPSLLKAVCELGFNVFGLIWLLLVPHYPVLILGPAAAFLKAGPMLRAFYIPILLLAIVALLRSGITLARPQWTWFPPWSKLLHSVLTLIVLNYMIQAVTKAPGGYPFVVLQEAVRDSPKLFQLAGIVNVSILVSIAFAWLGVCIAAIVQTWEFMRYLRKRTSALQRPGSIAAQ
jgi:hypothetical protein